MKRLFLITIFIICYCACNFVFAGGCPACPPNDACGDAITITVGGACENGDAGCDGTEGVVSCGGGNNANGASVWYKFVAPASGDVDISLTLNSGYYTPITVYGSCGGAEILCNYAAVASRTVNLTGLTPGNTYYIDVAVPATCGGPQPNTNFDICVTDGAAPAHCSNSVQDADETGVDCGGADCPACSGACDANEECAIAEVLSISSGVQECVVGCNTGVTDGPLLTGGCDDFDNPTVWYEVNVPVTDVLIDIVVTSTDLASPQFTLFSNTCGTFYNSSCVTGSGGSATLFDYTITPGETYFIAVTGNGGDEGDFDLCVTTNQNLAACNTQPNITTTPPENPGGGWDASTTVEFCFRIDEFLQVGLQYLQGIVPIIGDGWEPFNAATDVTLPLVCASCPGTDPGNTESGSWSWFADGVVQVNVNNYPDPGGLIGDDVGAGWFFLSDNAQVGPAEHGGDPDLSWGDGCYDGYNPPGPQTFACLTDAATGFGLQWEVCFNLTTVPFADCVAGEKDQSVRFITYSDGQVGNYAATGCNNDVSITGGLQVAPCCEVTSYPQTPSLCETTAGSGNATGVDLTSWNSAIDGGMGYTITWYSDAGFTTLVGTPTSVTATNGQIYYAEVDDGSCVGAETITFTIISRATANAGANNSICSGSTYTLTGTSATNYASLAWSTSGSGTFNNTTILAPIYTPSAGDITAGSVILTLQANGNAPCGNATDPMTLTITPAATSNAGANGSTCEGSTYTITGATATNYSSLVWTSSGTGTFNNSAILLPIYTPSAADITAGTVTLTLRANGNAPCGNVTDPMTLTIIRAATVNAGANGSTCAGNTYTISSATATNYASLSWSTSGSGTFNNNTILGPVYTPSGGDITAGTVTLTLQANGNAPCGNVTDPMILTIVPAATVNAGNNSSICSGSTFTLTTATATNYSSLLWTTSGTGTFNNSAILGPIYTPSGADITAGTVTLTLRANGNAPCGNITDPMTLTIVPAATVNAGANGNVCAGNTYTISGATATNYASLSWSTSGTGTFNNNTILGPVYTPSGADITAGSVILTLQANGNAPCTNPTDPMTLTIVPAPTVNAGSNGSICSGNTFTVSTATATNYASLSWSTTGTGTFNNNTILGPVYTPSAADITAGTVTLTLQANGNAPCINITDPMTLTIVPAPTVNAGSNGSICSGNTFTVSTATATNYASLSWSTSGSGTFNNSTILGPVYTPSAGDITAGSVILTLQANGNAPCTNPTDPMTLTITPAPTVSSGGNNSICAGNTYTVTGASATNYASLLWTTSGTGTFNNSTILGPIYTPSAADITAGSVTLTLRANGNAPCINITDPMTLTIVPAPTVNAGSNGSICSGNTFTVSTATATNYASLSWSTSGSGTFNNSTILGPVYTPSAGDITAGSVILTLQANGNAPCTNPTDPMTLTITPAPTVSSGGNNSICAGNTYTVTGASATNYASLLWTTSGTGTFNNSTILGPVYTPSGADITAGSVTLTLRANGNAPCINITSPMTLTIVPAATVNAGANGSTCAGFDFTVSTATATNYASLSWTTSGTGTFDDNTILGTIYTPSGADITAGSVVLTLQATGNAPCSNPTDPMTLTIVPAPTVVSGGNGTICEGETFTVTGATATNYTSLSWSASGTGTFNNSTILGTVYTPSGDDITAGSVILTLQANGNAPCVNVTDLMTLTINPLPSITSETPADESICGANDGTITIDATGVDPLTYSIDGGSTFFANGGVFTGLSSASYPVVVESADGCQVTGSTLVISVADSPPAPVAGTDTTYCNGDALEDMTAVASSGGTIFWYSNPGLTTVLGSGLIYTPANTIGIVNYYVSETVAGCKSPATIVTITINGVATVDAGANVTICAGGSYTNSDATATNYSSLSWSSSGSGSFNNTTIFGTTYTPDAADITAGSVTLTLQANGNAPCGNVTKDMVLTILPFPVISAGGADDVCEGSAYTLSAASGSDYSSLNWSSSGTGTFNNSTLMNPIYTPGAADIAAGSVTLTIQANGNAPCGNVTDNMLLTIIPSPSVNAGGNDIICEGSTYTVTAASATNYSSLNWISSGTGSFDDNSILGTTYSPDAADILTGSVTLTLQAIGNSPCITVSDSMILTIVSAPTLTIGANDTICEGNTNTISGVSASNYSALDWNTSGTGTFDDNSIIGPVYTPSAADIATGDVTLSLVVSSNAPCANTSDFLLLNIVPTPVLSAGSNEIICEGSTITISSSTASDYASLNWISSGTGSFDDNSILGTTYTPDATDILAGTVILTLQAIGNNPCATISDTMILTIVPAPTLSIGANDTVCEGSTLTISGTSATNYASLSWNTSGTGTFNDDAIIAPVYTPGIGDITAGDVTLTLLVSGDAPCANISDSVLLNIIPAPSVSAGSNEVICEGNTITISTSTAANYSSLSWGTSGTGSFDDNSLLATTYIPDAGDISSGTVILTLQANGNGVCSLISDPMTLTIVPAPTLTIGANDSMCEGSTYSVSGASASNYSVLSWSTSGTGTFDVNSIIGPVYTPSAADNASGSVTLTLLASGNAPCSSLTDSILLTIVPATSASAGSNAVICEGSTFTATASASNYLSLTWSSSGAGTFDDDTIPGTTYTPDPADVIAGSVTLTLQANGNAPCSNVTSSLILTIEPATTLTLASMDTICEGSNYTTSGVSSTNYSSISWSSSGTGTFNDNSLLVTTYTPNASDISDGTIDLTIVAEGTLPCLDVTNSIQLTIVPAPISNAGPADVVCGGNVYTFSAASASNYSSLNWTTTGTGSLINTDMLAASYTPSGNDVVVGSVIFTLKANGNSVCTSVSSTVTLSVKPLPLIIAAVKTDETICNLYDGTITITAAGTLPIGYSIDGGSNFYFNGGIFTNLGTGTYPVVIQSGDMCVTTGATLVVSSGSAPAAPITTGDSTYCSGQSLVNMTATVAVVGGIISWYSDPGLTLLIADSISTLATFNTIGTTNYYATETSGGCEGLASMVTVTINGVPVAYAGPDTALCEGIAYLISDATVTYDNLITWSSSGDGTFSNTTIANPTYTPGSNDNTVGIVKLFLRVDGFSPCNFTTDSLMLTINKPITVEAGQNASVCQGKTFPITGASALNQSALQWTTSGNGTFNNNSIINPVYTPGSGDILSGDVTLFVQGVSGGACPSVDDSLNLLINLLPVFDSVVENDATGCGTTDGTIDIYATYSGLLSYSINNGVSYPNTTGNFSGLSSGNFIIAIQTDSGCTIKPDTVSITAVGAPPAPVVSNDSTYCEEDVFADMTATDAFGGTLYWYTDAGLTNLIDSGSAVTPLTTVGTTDYYIVENAAGCTSPSATILIIINGLPTASAGTSPGICEGSPYTISNADTTNSSSVSWMSLGDGSFDDPSIIAPVYTPGANDIAAGSIILTLTATGNPPCGNIADAMNLAIIPAPTVFAGGNLSICAGETASVIGAGSTNSSSISWSTSGTGTFNDNTILGTVYTPSAVDIIAGSVNLTLQANGNSMCSNITDALILTIRPLPTVVGSDVTHITSCASDDGSITLYTNSTTYSYSIDGGVYGADSSFNGLSAGSHVIFVEENGCVSSYDTIINDNSGGFTIDTVLVQKVKCSGGSNASITIIASNATSYSIYGDSLYSALDYYLGLSAGTYSVYAMNAGSCKDSTIVVINNPDTLSSSLSLTNLLCFEDNSGAIEAIPSGGVPPYQFLWNAGGTSSIRGSLNAGIIYTVTITDANGCSITDSDSLSEPPSLTATSIATNSACGQPIGTMTVIADFGTPPYSYEWSDNPLDSLAANDSLIQGMYAVKITDANGCTIETYNSIIDGPLMTANIYISNTIDCYGDSSAVVGLTLQNAAFPPTFLWSTDATSPSLSNLGAGTYSATVTDAYNCTATDTIVIVQPGSMVVTDSISGVNETVSGACDGSLAISTSGGTSPYTYTWTGLLQTDSVITAACGGLYYVTTTDALGCTVVDSVFIEFDAPAPIVLVPSQVNLSCTGKCNGTATVSASGGIPPFTYLWNNNQTSATATSLCVGSYTVVVTDSVGGTATKTFTMTEPSPVVLTLSEMTPGCESGNNGRFGYLISGGTEPYKDFEVPIGDNDTSLHIVTGVPGGNYYFKAEDFYGCAGFDSISVEIYVPNIVSSDIDTVSCMGNNDGTIRLSLSGGDNSPDFLWSTNDTTQTLANIAAGDYTVTITSGNGCTAVYTIVVLEEYAECIKIPNAFTPNGNSQNDTWNIENIDVLGNNAITIEIFNRWGDVVFYYSGTAENYADVSNQWDGTFKGRDLPLGAFVYVVSLNDGKEPRSGVVTIVR